MTLPRPRPAAEAPPVRSVRSLAEIDDELAMLAMRERRHEEALAVARHALRDCTVRRQVLEEQRRRAIAVALWQLETGQLEAAQLAAAG